MPKKTLPLSNELTQAASSQTSEEHQEETAKRAAQAEVFSGLAIEELRVLQSNEFVTKFNLIVDNFNLENFRMDGEMASKQIEDAMCLAVDILTHCENKQTKELAGIVFTRNVGALTTANNTLLARVTELKIEHLHKIVRQAKDQGDVIRKIYTELRKELLPSEGTKLRQELLGKIGSIEKIVLQYLFFSKDLRQLFKSDVEKFLSQEKYSLFNNIVSQVEKASLLGMSIDIWLDGRNPSNDEFIIESLNHLIQSTHDSLVEIATNSEVDPVQAAETSEQELAASSSAVGGGGNAHSADEHDVDMCSVHNELHDAVFAKGMFTKDHPAQRDNLKLYPNLSKLNEALTEGKSLPVLKEICRAGIEENERVHNKHPSSSQPVRIELFKAILKADTLLEARDNVVNYVKSQNPEYSAKAMATDSAEIKEAGNAAEFTFDDENKQSSRLS